MLVQWPAYTHCLYRVSQHCLYRVSQSPCATVQPGFCTVLKHEVKYVEYFTCFRFLWPCIVSKLWREEEKTNKMQQSDVYYQHCLNMFRASLCPSSGEQRPCVTGYVVLLWFCWMWLVAVVGQGCVVGCEQCSHPTTQLLQRMTVTSVKCFNIWTERSCRSHCSHLPSAFNQVCTNPGCQFALAFELIWDGI